LAASDVNTFLRLVKSRLVEAIFLQQVSGLRRRKKRIEKKPSLYAVRARVAVQVEGQKTGMQTVEDRIILVMARSPDEAEKQLSREWNNYATPCINMRGALVRWHLEKITDVYDTLEETIDPAGTEVYSSLSRRRMKPAYEWHPNRKRRRTAGPIRSVQNLSRGS
jgi:hypothetical protein